MFDVTSLGGASRHRRRRAVNTEVGSVSPETM